MSESSSAQRAAVKGWNLLRQELVDAMSLSGQVLAKLSALKARLNQPITGHVQVT